MTFESISDDEKRLSIVASSTTSSHSARDEDDDTEYNKAVESKSMSYYEEEGEYSHSNSHSHSEDEEIGDEATDYHDESTDDDDRTDDDDDSHEGFSAFGSFTTAKQSLWSEMGGNSNKDSIFKPISSSTGTDTTGDRDRDQRYGGSDSHSFASEATEERGHTFRSSSITPQQKRGMILSPRKKNNLPPEYPDTPTSIRSYSYYVNKEDDVASPGGGLLTISGHSNTKHPVTTSIASPQHVPRILTNHQRVPGGAAAKLIGLKKDDGYHFVNDGDDALEVVAPEDELIKSRDMAKAEFSVGRTENKRYHAPTRVETKDDISLPNNGSIPRILDRSEVFHENAAAAIVSILTPSNKYTTNAPDEIITARSGDIQLSPSNSNSRSMMKALSKKDSSSPFAIPTKKSDISTLKTVGSDANSAVGDAIETLTMTGKNPLVQHLLTKKTERRLDTIKSRMKDPTKNLTDLMEAIASPKTGLFDRHYMVRRKNACGALKVLTANASHRINICWTLGVLPALASVLEDCGPDTLEDMFPNPTIRREYFEARKRAVSALAYLAIPQDNKLPIFHCPRLVASLVLVIEQDDGEARRGCCAVLAHLGKSKENRLIMAQIPGLIDAVAAVIEPKDNYSRLEEYSMSGHSNDSESEQNIFDRLPKDDVEISLSERSPQEAMSEDPGETSARYDEDPNEFLHGARQNVFALLSHLVKEKDNAYILARHSNLIHTLVAITKLQESSSQDFGLKLLAHLSRHRSNSKVLVFKMKDVVPAIVFATHSENADSRKYACYTLQNFSQDKPCRQELASVENLLSAVCRRIRGAKNPEEKLTALHTLKNLTDEPANLIPMTNTPECFATLMQVAHASDDSITETMQYLGCDALATLSHWFRSIATSGQRIGTIQQNTTESDGVKDELFVPSLRVLTWEPWQ